MGGKKKSTVGYKYFADAHFVLGLGPYDKISKIKYGDKVAWDTGTTGGTITISAPELYGGDSGDGGISGDVDVMMGSPTQARNSYLLSKLGSLVSAYRGVASLVFKNTYWGNANYFKAVYVLGSRIHRDENGAAQWYDAKAEIAQDSGFADMNPIHIVRETIVSTDGGLGRPASLIDDANFRAAADVLYAEKFGLSIEWTGDSTAQEFIDDVLKVIDARMYMHPRTKLYTIKLIRNDYDVDDLPVLGTRQIKRIEGYSRQLADDLPNSVAVTYWDSADESNATVQADDPPAIISSGAIRSLSQDYSSSITSPALAAKVAQRDLVASGSPLLKATLTCTSAAAGLLPGDPFVLDWPLYSDEPIVCRVVKTKRGGLLNQSVVLDVAEDVFRLDSSVVITRKPSGWVDPSKTPLATATPFAVEAPYYELVQRFGPTQVADFLATTPDAGMLLATAARSAGALNAAAFADGQQWAIYADLSPYATLSAAAGAADTVIDLAWTGAPVVGSHIQIDGELMRVDGFDSSGRTIVGRGVLDTVPAAHSTAAVAWAWDAFAVTDEVEHAAGETVGVRLQLRNNSRVGALSASVPVTFAARAIRPYPPGKLQLNGASYPVTIFGPLTVSWAHRNRLTQADQLIDASVGSVTPETGTTYNLRIYGAGVLKRTYSGISGAAQEYALANELADGGPFSSLRIELESVRDGMVSYQRHNIATTRQIFTGRLGTLNSIPGRVVPGRVL